MLSMLPLDLGIPCIVFALVWSVHNVLELHVRVHNLAWDGVVINVDYNYHSDMDGSDWM